MQQLVTLLGGAGRAESWQVSQFQPSYVQASTSRSFSAQSATNPARSRVMASQPTELTVKAESGSPYQLEKTQTLKASRALLKHIQSENTRKEAASNTKNLLKASSEGEHDKDAEPLWLILTTKKYISDQRRLKPGKILLPHSVNQSQTTSVCLITCDPQRTFKDSIAHPSFPATLSPKIQKVIGISKLKARYKSFESRRQLLDEHDVFLADARVITLLPKALGKTFYKGPKKPVPVNLEPYKTSDTAATKKGAIAKKSGSQENNKSKSIAPPLQIAKEIERTLSCTLVYLSPAVTTAIRVGLSSFTPTQVAENVDAVVQGMVNKFIPKGWRNIRSVHIKGPNTMALPIWLAEELWTDEGDVLEKATEAQTQEKRNQKKRKGEELEDQGSEKSSTGKVRQRQKRKLSNGGSK
ncbi:MAG: hypothetical protein LQ342_003927 [Letrouitia transgressa]|nr:MAG: hypothetical protein LQ342_003927 [Letrouitia transgressa]